MGNLTSIKYLLVYIKIWVKATVFTRFLLFLFQFWDNL